MKKTYNCPDVEVLTVNAASGLCQWNFNAASGNTEVGPTDIYDPANS